MSIVLALRQEYHEISASLDNKVRPYLKRAESEFRNWMECLDEIGMDDTRIICSLNTRHISKIDHVLEERSLSSIPRAVSTNHGLIECACLSRIYSHASELSPHGEVC